MAVLNLSTYLGGISLIRWKIILSYSNGSTKPINFLFWFAIVFNHVSISIRWKIILSYSNGSTEPINEGGISLRWKIILSYSNGSTELSTYLGGISLIRWKIILSYSNGSTKPINVFRWNFSYQMKNNSFIFKWQY